MNFCFMSKTHPVICVKWMFCIRFIVKKTSLLRFMHVFVAWQGVQWHASSQVVPVIQSWHRWWQGNHCETGQTLLSLLQSLIFHFYILRYVCWLGAYDIDKSSPLGLLLYHLCEFVPGVAHLCNFHFKVSLPGVSRPSSFSHPLGVPHEWMSGVTWWVIFLMCDQSTSFFSSWFSFPLEAVLSITRETS